MGVVAVGAHADRVSGLASVGLSVILVGALGFCAEQGGAGRKVVDVAEAQGGSTFIVYRHFVGCAASPIALSTLALDSRPWWHIRHRLASAPSPKVSTAPLGKVTLLTP